MDQPGKVANPARGQLNRENEHSPVPRACLRIWSREAGSAVPSRVSLLISIVRLNLVGSEPLLACACEKKVDVFVPPAKRLQQV